MLLVKYTNCKHQPPVETRLVKILFPQYFLWFVDEEHAIAEMMARAVQGQGLQNSQGQKSAQGKVMATGERPRQGGQSNGRCGACEGNHQVISCPTFKSMSAEDKKKVCMGSGLCFKCLQSGHASRFCKEDGRCSTCDRYHHTLLHALFPSSNPAPPAGRTTGSGQTNA